MALRFDRHLDSSAVEMPAKFQNSMIIIAPYLAATRLHEIWREDINNDPDVKLLLYIESWSSGIISGNYITLRPGFFYPFSFQVEGV